MNRLNFFPAILHKIYVNPNWKMPENIAEKEVMNLPAAS
jgi:murein L,D-transpeptidase YcbB/YkuD